MPDFDFNTLMNSSTTLIFIVTTIPFVIIGAIMLLFVLRSRRKVRASMSWERTSGTVLFSDVESRRSTDSDNHTSISHYARVVYEYRVMGQRYQSDRLNLGEVGLGDYNKVAAKIAQYPQGSTVEVFYNPVNPVESALERTAPSGNALLFAFALIFSILVCSSVVMFGAFAMVGGFAGEMMTQVPR